MRNMACALLLSHGIPMLQMGDEYGHSKNGNNNTYCHDSPLNWVDWQQVARDEQGFARFMRGLIAFRSVRYISSFGSNHSVSNIIIIVIAPLLHVVLVPRSDVSVASHIACLTFPVFTPYPKSRHFRA
jgi:pullulanase/glycogen debranching enzyme